MDVDFNHMTSDADCIGWQGDLGPATAMTAAISGASRAASPFISGIGGDHFPWGLRDSLAGASPELINVESRCFGTNVSTFLMTGLPWFRLRNLLQLQGSAIKPPLQAFLC